MQTRMTGLFFALTLATSSGCSTETGDSPAPAPTGCGYDWSHFQASATPVSFKRPDAGVVAIFGRSCSYSSCHGDDGRSQARLYLGPNVNNVSGPDKLEPYWPPDEALMRRIYDGLIGGNVTYRTSFPLITPG